MQIFLNLSKLMNKTLIKLADLMIDGVIKHSGLMNL
jgi:hypothetical protein